MEIDYKQLASEYEAENYLVITENDKLLKPIISSFEISLLMTEMIGETLLFAAEKGYSDKIKERLCRLEKINMFVSMFDNLSFDKFRYRQHLKVVTYQRGKLQQENEQLKAKLAKYEKWEKDEQNY